uniref:FBA_2 domain-containing protein n=1 Tax=Caenorhabditis tropicalis TaxID=1561998 RepID=A0A1I7U2S7_9PELO
MGFWRRDLMELINLISSLYQPFECSIEGDPKDILERLPIIENVQYTCLSFAKSKVIDKFFDTYPNQKSTQIAGIINGTPKPNSKLYEVGEVELNNPFLMTTDWLENFKGHYLIIKRSSYHDSDLIEFLRKWISGEDHLNIEAVLLISNTLRGINPESIMAEFEATKWDGKRRPRAYVYKKGYSSVWETPTDCSEFLDVERKTDGKLASVCITHDNFTFLVWN